MIFWQLFYEFFKIGLFSVGGGLATLPFLYDLAARRPWFDEHELLNMIAVSESTPGPIGVNMATYTGFTTAGIFGGVMATFSLVLPSVIIIVLIAKFLSRFSESQLVQDAFYGLRPATTGLIAAAGFSIVRVGILRWDTFIASWNIADLFEYKALILFAVILLLTNKVKGHPIFYIAGAAAVGVIFHF